QQLFSQSPVSLAAVLMRNINEGNRLEFLLRITQHFLVNGICGEEAAIQISEGNANGRILKDGSPPLFTLSQRLFGPLALRVVIRRRVTLRFSSIWPRLPHVISFRSCSTKGRFVQPERQRLVSQNRRLSDGA